MDTGGRLSQAFVKEKKMYNEILIENLSEKEIEDMINKVSAVAGTVISDSMTGLKAMLKSEGDIYYLKRLSAQWKYGEKLTNPLITFTKALKGGAFDEMPEKDIDDLHDAAVSLSKFWRSKSELSSDEMKNNIGYMMVQEMIIRAMTDKTEDIDKQKKRRNEAV